jgi:hypothetical protein
MTTGRRRWAPAAAACTALLATACATVQVSTDYDPTVDFSRYHTFQLVGGHLLNEGVPDDSNTLVKDRIAAALRVTLQGKGLQEGGKEAGGADLDVGYFGGARTRTEIETMPTYGPGFGPFWYGGWWDPAFNTWWATTYNEGTLVIDLVDAHTNRLVWRAYARTEIHVPVSQEKIQKAVTEAFRSFPPSHK